MRVCECEVRVCMVGLTSSDLVCVCARVCACERCACSSPVVAPYELLASDPMIGV